jgi:PDZ domain
LIDHVSLNLAEYDPSAVIRAVNHLQSLGERKSISAMREYLRVASYLNPGREGMNLILRILFDIPADVGYMPPLSMGKLEPPPPANLRDCPRYPLVLVQDIPFCLPYGWSLAGHLPEGTEHLDYFEKHGHFRDKPLVPARDPVGVATSLASPDCLPFSTREIERIRPVLERQADALVAGSRGQRVTRNSEAPSIRNPVSSPDFPHLGFQPRFGEDDHGVFVEVVKPDRPAAKAGLKEGDRIVEIAGNPVHSKANYISLMSAQKKGQTISIGILRGGKAIILDVVPD